MVARLSLSIWGMSERKGEDILLKFMITVVNPQSKITRYLETLYLYKLWDKAANQSNTKT